MPISTEDYKRVFRTIPIPIQYFDSNGEVKADTLSIKYRPLTQAWVDQFNEIQQGYEVATAAIVEEGKALAVRENALSVIKGAKKKERTDFEADLEAYKKRVKEISEKYKLQLAELLAHTLIDVDMIDTNKQRIEPKAEFLVGLDFEFLGEIQSGILKKTFPAKTS